MAANNSFTGSGRLTKDAELRYTGEGKPKVGFTLAVDGFGKEAPADFIPCTFWGTRAEAIVKHMTKGQEISIEGRIRTYKYEKDGKTIYGWEVNVNDVHIHWKKRNGGEQAETEAASASSDEEDEIPF